MSSYRINVQPDERIIIANEKDSILDTAIRNGIKITVGCKGGGCGVCKIQVLEGDVDLGHSARSVLTLNEIEDGYALACQTKVNSDVVISYPKK